MVDCADTRKCDIASGMAQGVSSEVNSKYQQNSVDSKRQQADTKGRRRNVYQDGPYQ